MMKQIFITFIFLGAQCQEAVAFNPFVRRGLARWSRRSKQAIGAAVACAGLAVIYFAHQKRRATFNRLMTGISENNKDMVRQAIADGADLNWHDSKGDTPLTLAAQKGRLTITKRLLQAGADPNISNAYNVPPLIIAISKSDLYKKHGKVAHLLLEHGADPNQRANGRTSALMSAIRKDNESIVNELIKRGANLDQPVADLYRWVPDFREDYYVPLRRAVAHRLYDTTLTMLQHGANPNKQNWDGETALGMAAIKKDTHAAAMLLSYGADPNIVSSSGDSPLSRAAFRGKHEIIRQLLDHGASIQPPISTHGEINLDPCCPLGKAIRRGHFGAVRLLLPCN